MSNFRDLVNELPSDPVEALASTAKILIDRHGNQNTRRDLSYDDHLFALSLFIIFLKRSDIEMPIPDLVEKEDANRNIILQLANDIWNRTTQELNKRRLSQDRTKVDQWVAMLEAKLENQFLYKFTDDDIARLQELINELRGEIGKAQFLTKDHKRRLLGRLEKLQSELHKEVSDLDRFWGLVGDAGVAIKKFGKDAKPIVDRIREMSEIVWKTISLAEHIPHSDPPKLPFDVKGVKDDA